MMKTDLIKRIKHTILQKHLISQGDSVLVAVSGGADSVCLLEILCALKDELCITLSVAHLNHMLRGKDADEDETFVSALCEKHAIPFYKTRVDVAKIAREQKISLEEAGRGARYDFFLQLRKLHNINKIATAHNKNDNVETVCMRFLRGTGIHGLAGIPIANDIHIIRPLLYTSRAEIENFLQENHLSYRTDGSNLTDDYTRNRIRHHLLPDIEENYNRNFVNTLSENIKNYSEADAYLKRQTDRLFADLVTHHSYGLSVDCKSLMQEDAYMAKRFIKECVYRCSKLSPVGKVVNFLYDSILFGTADTFVVNKLLTVYKKYGRLYFVTKKKPISFSYTLSDEKEINIMHTGEKLTFSKGIGKVSYKDKNVIYVKQSMCTDKIFTVRNRLSEDRIKQNYGHKRLKSLMIDAKIPVFLRDEIPVLLAGDEIIWVCGMRDNPSYRATEDEPYIKITYTGGINHA